MSVILRAAVFHVPRNPFREEHALEAFADGALVVEQGRIAACGDYNAIRAAYPQTPERDLRGGILLPGREGQDIRAASSGRVVYNGSGIRGYGNLIIIKHGENLLSAYAHTRESLVHDGQEVTLGQVIAHMGEGAPQKPVLYFEIRRNGKPVDPLTLLPVIK